MRMTFVSNHDKNAWEGTPEEEFGDALDAVTVLSVVGEGIPLLYGGQEAGNDRRLAFFERDPIVWRDHPAGDLYRGLFALKHRMRALWNAPWGARMVRVPNTAEASVLTFVRQGEADGVFAAFNFSGQPQTVTLGGAPHAGTYTDAFSGEAAEFAVGSQLDLEPWGYRVFVR
jgi:hypothetical protein